MNNIEITVLGNQYTTLNQRQIEEVRCYLSFIGNYCGANADDNKGCGKSVAELKTLYNAELIKNGKKICQCSNSNTNPKKRIPAKCPDCKGIIRTHPFLLINEKNGNGIHRVLVFEDSSEIYELYGNVCYYCKSCNMKFDRRKGDIKPSESATFHARKSHDIRPKFKNEMLDFLSKYREICYKAMINKWSGRDDYKCSQDLLESAFDQELDRTISLIEISEFKIKCNYPKCNGYHVILYGEDPIKIVSDYETYINEKETTSK